MRSQPKTEPVLPLTGATRNPWRNLFTNKETGRFNTDLVLTIILITLLVVMVGVTWLPTHISENLLIPGQIIFLIATIIFNSRVFRLQSSYANQLIIASLVLQVGVIEILNWLFPSNVLFFQYFVLPFQAYRFFGEKVGLRLSILTWLVYAIHSLFVFKDLQSYLLAMLAGTLALVMLTSRYRQDLRERLERKRREQLLAELETSHRQLKAYAAQVEEFATIEERNRLAREIHDSLGHYLTAINIQLEKAMLQHDDKPDEAMQTISDTKRLASEALQDIRRSVATLREQAVPPFSIVEKLEKLVNEVRNNNRFQIELMLGGSEQDFSKQVLQTLYRVAQEGLTNIQKNAWPRQVLVRLELAKTEAHLLIQDDGSGFDTAKLLISGQERLGGYGLQGIRERLELVGGNFKLESNPGKGTSLQVTVPKDPFRSHSLKGLLLQT